jgi:hypothetical protein
MPATWNGSGARENAGWLASRCGPAMAGAAGVAAGRPLELVGATQPRLHDRLSGMKPGLARTVTSGDQDGALMERIDEAKVHGHSPHADFILRADLAQSGARLRFSCTSVNV